MRFNFQRALEYLKEVKRELKKVNWLTFREAFNYALAVILITFLVAVFLGTVDYLVTLFLKKFIL